MRRGLTDPQQEQLCYVPQEVKSCPRSQLGLQFPSPSEGKQSHLLPSKDHAMPTKGLSAVDPIHMVPSKWPKARQGPGLGGMAGGALIMGEI